MVLIMNKTELILDSIKSLTAVINEQNIKYNDLESNIQVFLHILQGVKDFRVQGRTKFKLENILGLSILLIMRNEFRSFSYAANYVSFYKERYAELGLIEGDITPSHDTFRRVFMLLDANSVRDCIINRLKGFLLNIVEKNNKNKNNYKLYNVDGKTFNGSGRNKKDKVIENINMFNVYDSSNRICLSSTPLANKESEIPEFQRMLRKFNLDNVIVTADAIHCQKKSCEVVISRKGDYMFTVKTNQRALCDEIETKLNNNKDEVKVIYSNDATYEIFHLPKDYIGLDFKGQKSYVRYTSNKRKKQAKDKTSILHFLTSLEDDNLIVEAIDNRWNIENDLHKIKDEFFFEDDYTFTDKNAVKVMAVLNNICFSLFKIATAFLNNSNMTYTKIEYRDNPERLLGKIVPLLERDNFEELIRNNLKGGKNKK